LIQLPLRRRSAAALAFVALFALPIAQSAFAQQDVPPATPQPAEAPDPNAMPSFPAPEAADFTANAPSKEVILGFLKATWGYDPNRLYQVQRITKTAVDGVSSVVVLVGEKGNKQAGALQFFAMPDGKHIITAGEMLPFGDNPYAEARTALLAKANGPSRGGAGKDLELVEFADFQCPHCKEAQATVEKILADFPKAHFVYQSFPLVKIHPQASRSAAYGACVAKLGGDKAFFDYAAAVYDGQAGLSSDEGATLTLNSAVTKAGQDPAKVEACSKTPEAKAAIDADIKLAGDLNVTQTPFLFVNGRGIPLGGVPYDTLKLMITWHQNNDGAAK